MKNLLKLLIVWLTLVAIPFQGFASASMLDCASIHATPPVHQMAGASPAHHDHQAMLNAANGGKSHHSAQADSDPHHPAGGKCHSGAACCVGAAMAPSLDLAVLPAVRHVAHFFFELDRVASVDLALPERPPQTSLT